MSKWAKFRRQLLSGAADRNIRFDDLTGYLLHLGFDSKTRGSHSIFWRDGIEEIINLQPLNRFAKPYQVRQVREIIVKSKLGAEDDGA